MTAFNDHLPSATEFIQVPRAGGLRRLFAFPNPVNEYAARSTAGIVVALALAALVSGQAWLVAVIAAGFVLRLAFGPRISPAALLSVKVLAPRFGRPKLVPGPPKRFAQGIGAVLSIGAIALLLSGASLAGWTLIVLLLVAASLEAFVGLCLGCAIFGILQRRGLIPAGICEECANFSFRKA
ncbi:DUF4395 domain-containing protein [Arthrobacter sp. SDTb3-6]|uniref:DUF4395 domain-containing protein n=1 Tax=Arthrobacter sp. SDTb3-6 TaxID=2713571 RepID=UPI00159E67F3|nr:DUF4395 domain-containing protein [Arthrobacter sp. SDTb3-6]NVM98623.1 DUF4395 domain-containing protein [Arthrobacter sp. SDTb3-6]